MIYNNLENKHVAILGLGGLGGYALEYIIRLGVKKITIIDKDKIDNSNLDRQIISKIDNIGKSKVDEALKRIRQITNDIEINSYKEEFNDKNAYDILKNVDIVIDGFDNYKSRELASSVCSKLNIPFIYGSIREFYGMVSTIMPNDNTLEKIYKNYKEEVEKKYYIPSFMPALIASIQVSECMKIINKEKDILQNKILTINTLNNEYKILKII